MPGNSQLLLQDVLDQQRSERAPDSSQQYYFEIFCAEQILKDYNLSYEELQTGIVDGEHDGGVDSVYSFVNGELVGEDFDCSHFKRGVVIELHIIQSKTAAGFSETPLNHLISMPRYLLSLDSTYADMPQYNDSLKSIIDNFRNVFRGLASKFPDLKISYHYAAMRSDGQIHENLARKADELESVAKELFDSVSAEVRFLDARKLLDLARRHPPTSHDLRVSRNLSDTGGYVVLSSLGDYVRFLKGTEGKIQAELFESNVRDFQGNTEVNNEIKNTLVNERSVDFWCMNNGVTVLASRATLNGDIVTMENPQIVNGLQTSRQIAEYYQPDAEDNRTILVKIVSSEDEEIRDKIIKSTNSQNAIQPATLRATDKVQRDIEAALQSAGLHYDRRKNFYKNQGKPVSKIISIPLMAQSIMTILLARPDTARARPASLIKNDDDYSRVFSEEYPIQLYTNAAILIRRVEAVLKDQSEMTAKDRNNLRFYVLFWLIAVLTNSPRPTAYKVAQLDGESVNDVDIELAMEKVRDHYWFLGGTDEVAKGPDLRTATVDGVAVHIEKVNRSKQVQSIG